MTTKVKTKWLHQTETQVDTEIFTTKEYENTQVFARVAQDVLLVAVLETNGIIDGSTWQTAEFPLMNRIEDASHVQCLCYMDFTFTMTYNDKLGYYFFSKITAE